MATPFSAVYAKFTEKITDYSFLNLTEVELDDILHGYLVTATVRFKDCKKNLSNRDDEIAFEFTDTLTDEEIEILGTLMVVAWLTNKVNTTELLKQQLSDKDFKIFSQAQHLKEVKDLRRDMEAESNALISGYLWGDIADLEELNL